MFKVSQPYYYQATMLVNWLRLSAVVIYCCHGDGSDGRHVCSRVSRPYTLLVNACIIASERSLRDVSCIAKLRARIGITSI